MQLPMSLSTHQTQYQAQQSLKYPQHYCIGLKKAFSCPVPNTYIATSQTITMAEHLKVFPRLPSPFDCAHISDPHNGIDTLHLITQANVPPEW